MEQEQTFAQGVGSRIAERRKQLGLTQEQAAEMSGLSAQFFACVERGIKNIRAENLLRVCRAFGVSADYLLTGQPSELDRSNILSMLEPLDARQLHCLEEIIRQYLIACGHTTPPETHP